MGSLHSIRAGLFALCGLCLAAGSAAEAARQGDLGAVSTGSLTISVSVAPRAQISSLKDISFGSADPALGVRTAQDICIWSNSAAGGYTLTAGGSGSGGAFELADGEQTLPYSVEWAQRPGQTSGQTLASSATATNLQAAATQSDCASGAGSASLVVAIDPAQLAAAQPGVAYTGSLTLTVSPQ